jgi:hypothetical protein
MKIIFENCLAPDHWWCPVAGGSIKEEEVLSMAGLWEERNYWYMQQNPLAGISIGWQIYEMASNNILFWIFIFSCLNTVYSPYMATTQ